MIKKRPGKWSLNPKEVSCSMLGSSSGKSGQLERKLKTTGSAIFLTHLPTGAKVEGAITPGNYSKKEMQQKRKILKQSLFKELEQLVAKNSGIEGF